jgi:hypothetical protein
MVDHQIAAKILLWATILLTLRTTVIKYLASKRKIKLNFRPIDNALYFGM